MSVSLVAVDVMGNTRRSHRFYWDRETAKTKYPEYEGEVNDGCIDHQLRTVVHAVCDGKDWPTNLPYGPVGRGWGPDRSCHPDRCDCEALGLPVKTLVTVR